MKLVKSIAISSFFFATQTFASQELIINNEKLEIIFSNGADAKVSSCNDFTYLHNSGLKTKELPGLSDPDYQQAHMELSKCLMNSWSAQNGYLAHKTPSITISEIIKNFPAKADLRSESNTKTIQQAIPDLRKKDDRFISYKKSEGYLIKDSWSFRNESGKQVDFVMLVGYATKGTMAVARLWRIDSRATMPWSITEIQP